MNTWNRLTTVRGEGGGEDWMNKLILRYFMGKSKFDSIIPVSSDGFLESTQNFLFLLRILTSKILLVYRKFSGTFYLRDSLGHVTENMPEIG